MFQVYCETYIMYENVFNCRHSIIIPFLCTSPCYRQWNCCLRKEFDQHHSVDFRVASLLFLPLRQIPFLWITFLCIHSQRTSYQSCSYKYHRPWFTVHQQRCAAFFDWGITRAPVNSSVKMESSGEHWCFFLSKWEKSASFTRVPADG